jgi:hypothetical protein
VNSKLWPSEGISAYDFSCTRHVFGGATSFHHSFSLRTTSWTTDQKVPILCFNALKHRIKFAPLYFLASGLSQRIIMRGLWALALSQVLGAVALTAASAVLQMKEESFQAYLENHVLILVECEW